MGPLIPFAISIAPEIARWLLGSSSERTAAAVADIAASLTGTKDEAAQQIALERDPELACQLRVEIAKVAAQAQEDARTAETTLVSACLADTGASSLADRVRGARGFGDSLDFVWDRYDAHVNSNDTDRK